MTRTVSRLLLTILLALGVATAAQGQLVTTGIRGYWKLDETSGTTATDSSGQSSNGTYTSATLGNTGVVIRAAGFSTTSSRISLPSTVLNSQTNLSVVFWVKITSDSNAQTILSGANGSTSNEVWIYIQNGQLGARYKNGAVVLWNLTNIDDGDWHHIAVVTNSTTDQTTVYQNAVSVGTQSLGFSGSLSISSGGLIVAQEQDSVGGSFDSNERLIGDVDELLIYNTPLTSTQVELLYGFLGHWKLNQTSGTTATDLSPIGNNGTYTNSPTLNQAGPYPATVAVDMDGSNDYVSIGTESNYDVTGPMTIAAWFRVDAFDLSNQTIISKGSTASWELSRSGSTNFLRFLCFGLSTNTTVTSSTNVNDGAWHHVVALYDGSTLSLYIDGSLDNSVAATGSITTNSQNVRIGANAEAASRNWEGRIFDVRLYARALTNQEIAEIYGRVGNWKLNETSGTVATDSSLMGKNGTYTNSPTLGGTGPYTGTRAAQFDGNNDYVNLPDYTTNFSGGYSIAVWGRPTNSGYWARFADFGSGEDVDNFFFGRQATTSTLESTIHDGSLGVRSPITETNAIVNNAWHHYTVTVDSSGGAKLYVDGVEVASTTIGVPSNVTRTSNFIARSNWAVDDYFQGKMHDMHLFNRALSAAEVQEIMLGADTWHGIRIMKWVEVQ